jgi:multidrug resistance efflux pump
MNAPRLKLTGPVAVQIGRVGLTSVLAIAAAFAGWRLWTHYEADPWTRDGRVRAEVVQIAPDVPGLVTAMTRWCIAVRCCSRLTARAIRSR